MRQGIVWAIIAVMVWQFAGSAAFAGECSGLERDRLEELGQEAGQRLVDGYGGGQDIRVTLLECSHNRYSGRWKGEIRVEWNGAMFRSNQYAIRGELTVPADGGKASFSRRYANEAVEGLDFFGQMAATVIVLGVLASDSNS